MYISHFYWKVSKYPKGPFPLPFIGNLLEFPAENIQKYFDELSKTYGPCFTVWTPSPAVVLTDYDHIKDAFVTQGETFTYRAHRPPESLLQPTHNTGVLVSDGENWKLQRRTSLKILRDFGLGRNLMEEQVKRSIQEMMAQLESIKDKRNVDMFWPIQLCVGNVINESLFGYHFKYDDCEKFKTLINIITSFVRNVRSRSSLLISSFPWMRYLPIVGENGYHLIKRNMDQLHKFLEEEVVSQIKEYDGESEPGNFVHAYMKLMKQTGNPNLDLPNLCGSVIDFWGAGMETTSTSLRWHLAYIMKHPEIQDKSEHALYAVIHEIQRCSNMLPVLNSHLSHESTVIQGRHVPAGTTVMAQLWSVMKNDSVFVDSEKFNPGRYLLADGKTFIKAVLDKTVPFSIGKRNCVGEGLARMELFLIFSALIQKYEFVPTSKIDLTPAVFTTKPYTCQLIPQNV